MMQRVLTGVMTAALFSAVVAAQAASSRRQPPPRAVARDGTRGAGWPGRRPRPGRAATADDLLHHQRRQG